METQPAGTTGTRVQRRRRGGATGSSQRACPHCGRTFKRSEHLVRHVRTHTKEKPFICRCGAAFTRRDLLTRHERNTTHHNNRRRSPDAESAQSQQTTAEADLAAAASLSGMSMNPWDNQPQSPSLYPTQDHEEHNGEDEEEDAAQQFQQPLLSQEFLDSGQDIRGFDHFREFANFIDVAGLPAEWSPYFNDTGPGDDLVDPQLRESKDDSAASGTRTGRAGTPFNYWLPSAPGERRLAETSCENRLRPVDMESQVFRVTEDQISRLSIHLESFRDVFGEDFKLPSRHTLTRYICSYFQGFHLHLPFLHPQTFSLLDTPLELVLAVATVGAQYCFEHRNSERLFFAGKAVLLARLANESEKFGPKTSTYLSLHNYTSFAEAPVGRAAPTGPWEQMDSVRSLVILMGYATWERKEKFMAEAFLLQGLLVQVLRDIGLDEEEENDQTAELTAPHIAWIAWVRQESVRRAKLIAFTFLHIHSVAYNVYPVLRSNEVRLRLPCSTAEWKARNASQWQFVRRQAYKEQLNFQEALSLLLRPTTGTATLDPIPTPLGNYVLLHGLLQRIHIVRDLSLPIMDQSASLPGEEVNKLERGLRSWTSGWQQAPESSLDPNNENGPIPFTSSSLLGLAYVRIYLNLGPYRQLETRDPSRIARALCRSPHVERSDGVISALLYAAHALSIPVRLGVDRVARSQAFFWSVRHSLSGLECAVLLSKWLNSLKNTMHFVPLTDNEDRILHWVRCIVDEAYTVVDFDESEPEVQGDPASLSLAVLGIWAHFFKGNTQWPFINMIGLSLELYRDKLLRGIGH